jgi:lipopolysaccharide export system ATP-binding protein
MNTLTVKHLEKSFKARTVVKDVSLELSSGQVIGLLGPNGAGKTTSFYMIVGLIQSDRGQVLLNGQDITHLPMHMRARLGIGYLPQESSIFRKLSVADNIMAILELRPDLSKAQRLEQLDNLLSEFHISHLKDAISMTLSGGEKRRVEIARALAMDPIFILLDEPFAGIDPISVIDIKRIINHLCHRGLGILITDHNVRETLTICQKAYIVNQGEIIAAGKSEDILNNALVREVYLGDEFDL